MIGLFEFDCQVRSAGRGSNILRTETNPPWVGTPKYRNDSGTKKALFKLKPQGARLWKPVLGEVGVQVGPEALNFPGTRGPAHSRRFRTRPDLLGGG
jgi:hypothetical protein